MATLSPQDIQDMYLALPEDLQDAIFSPTSMDVYNQIQARYGLDAHQREELSIQSGFLMMGLVEPKQYVPVLADKLGIPRDKAAFIAQEVNLDILHTVRESLKKVHGLGEAAQQQQQQQETPAPVGYKAPGEQSSPQPQVQPETSMLNQKLGSAFRAPAAPQVDVPTYSHTESQISPTAQTQTTDPYRELPA
jgi:hypothetical protein